MIQTMKKQDLQSGAAPGRPMGHIGRWLTAAISTLCISTSTIAWADTESYDLADFDGISAAEGIHMQVTIGDVFDVTAESEDPVQLERLELDVRRGILRAQMDYGLFSLNWAEKKTVTLRVTMPNLNHAEASSGAEIMADAMSGSNAELVASSGALLQINAIDGGAISVDVANGAHIKIAEGTCTSLSASVSRGSSLDMEKVACANAEIDASAGSRASVHADKSIAANASTGSNIRVYGAHEKIEINNSSGGDVIFP